MRLAPTLVPFLLAGAVTAAGAQDAPENPHARQGFFFGFGLGVGSAGLECEACGADFDRETGLSGTLRLGGTLSQTVQLGVATNGWYKVENDITYRLAFLSAIIVLYPSSRGGFFFQLGLGGMSGRVADDFNEITTLGGAAMLGIGYDIRIGSSVSLTPYANALASNGNLEVDGFEILDENFNPNVVQFGLAISTH